MRESTIIWVVAALLFFAPRPAAPAEASATLEDTVRAPAEIIRERGEELTTLRQDQKRSDDRVLALEDQIAMSAAQVDAIMDALRESP